MIMHACMYFQCDSCYDASSMGRACRHEARQCELNIYSCRLGVAEDWKEERSGDEQNR
jgi:hypothetical protein